MGYLSSVFFVSKHWLWLSGDYNVSRVASVSIVSKVYALNIMFTVDSIL